MPLSAPAGRQRRVEPVSNRVRRDGKFFRLGSDKFFVKGVTYGPFKPNGQGEPLPEPEMVPDFGLMRDLGINCLRIYHTPPGWFLDLAQEHGLRIFLDVAWPKNLTFVGDKAITEAAHTAVRTAAQACGNHPAVFAISVVNEIPPDIVRFVGRLKVEEFIDELVCIVKDEAPDCLVTFANFPTTEYLQPREIDFACFNVYLHESKVFRNYLGPAAEHRRRKAADARRIRHRHNPRIYRGKTGGDSLRTREGGLRRRAGRHVHLQLHR